MAFSLMFLEKTLMVNMYLSDRIVKCPLFQKGLLPLCC